MGPQLHRQAHGQTGPGGGRRGRSAAAGALHPGARVPFEEDLGQRLERNLQTLEPAGPGRGGRRGGALPVGLDPARGRPDQAASVLLPGQHRQARGGAGRGGGQRRLVPEDPVPFERLGLAGEEVRGHLHQGNRETVSGPGQADLQLRRRRLPGGLHRGSQGQLPTARHHHARLHLRLRRVPRHEHHRQQRHRPAQRRPHQRARRPHQGSLRLVPRPNGRPFRRPRQSHGRGRCPFPSSSSL